MVFFKNVSVVLMNVLLLSNLSIVSNAEQESLILDKALVHNAEEGVTPYFETIYIADVYTDSTGVQYTLITQENSSLRVTIKIYQQNGGSSSLLLSKTFSEKASILQGKVDFSFKTDKKYKIIVDFYADGESKQIEKYI